MRRLREERAADKQRQYDARVRATPAAAPAAPAAVAPAAVPLPPTTTARSPAPAEPRSNAKAPKTTTKSAKSWSKASKQDAAEGKCSGCGKVRSLVNGMVSNHQKGFGKMCPGSRKEPA
jgi:hypothetical protein